MDYPKDKTAIKDKPGEDNQPSKVDNDFLNQEDRNSSSGSQEPGFNKPKIKFPKVETETESEKAVPDKKPLVPEASFQEGEDQKPESSLSPKTEKPILEVVEDEASKEQQPSEAKSQETSSGLSSFLSQEKPSQEKKGSSSPDSSSLGISSDPLLDKKAKKQPEEVKNDFESTYEPQAEVSDKDTSGQTSKEESSDKKQVDKLPELVKDEEDKLDKTKLGPQPMMGVRPEKMEENVSEKEDELKEEDLALADNESSQSGVSLGSSPQASPENQSLIIAKKSSLDGIKKLLPIALAILVIGLIVFSVLNFVLPKFKKTKQAEITYWGLWEPESVMNEIIADFNKQYPDIKVNYTMQSKQEYRERLQSALARGEGPDIFRFHITWVPMFKNQLDAVPDTVFSKTEYQNTFYPIVVKQLLGSSGYLGIPLEVDTLALFYNKSIFQLAGRTPPTTWEELRTLANELTIRDSSGRIQTAGVALGNTTNVEHWSDILGLLMLQNGADLKAPDGCNLVQGEEECLGVDALRFYTIFSKSDQVWDNTMPNSTQAFALGKLAMYFGYSWDVFELKARNPNLDFGVVEAPKIAGEKTSWGSFWVEGVNNKSEFKDQAWLFMKFLSQKETLQKLYTSASKVRAFGEPYPRLDMKSLVSSDPLAYPFLSQASYAQTWYLCSNTYDNGINDKMIDYFKDAVNAVNLNKDPKEALQTASMGVVQLLSQYGLGSYSAN